MFICGTPLDTSAGMEDKLEGNLEKARELVKEAGYDGEPVILMHPTDLAVLAPLPPIAKAAWASGRVPGSRTRSSCA